MWYVVGIPGPRIKFLLMTTVTAWPISELRSKVPCTYLLPGAFDTSMLMAPAGGRPFFPVPPIPPPQPQQAGRGGSPRNPMSYADPDVEETNPVRSSQCRSAVKRAEITETKKDRTSMNAPPSVTAVSGRAMTPPRRALPALRP